MLNVICTLLEFLRPYSAVCVHVCVNKIELGFKVLSCLPRFVTTSKENNFVLALKIEQAMSQHYFLFFKAKHLHNGLLLFCGTFHFFNQGLITQYDKL